MINGRKRPRSPVARTYQTIRQKNCDEMVEQLRARGELSPEVSEKIIRNILENNSDDIAITTAKISLLCPLGKMFMNLPTRAITCNHLQCFDGQFYIRMNAARKVWQWQCPICQQRCAFENLFVDGFFMNILRSEKLKANVTHIRLNIDGSWDLIENESIEYEQTAAEDENYVRNKKARIELVNCEEDKLDPVSSFCTQRSENENHDASFSSESDTGSTDD